MFPFSVFFHKGFSVRIASPKAAPENYGDTLNPAGAAKTPFTGKVGKGFFIEVVNADSASTVPSLGCGVFGQQVSLGCDRDTGTLPIEDSGIWCLVITN